MDPISLKKLKTEEPQLAVDSSIRVVTPALVSPPATVGIGVDRLRAIIDEFNAEFSQYTGLLEAVVSETTE